MASDLFWDDFELVKYSKGEMSNPPTPRGKQAVRVLPVGPPMGTPLRKHATPNGVGGGDGMDLSWLR